MKSESYTDEQLLSMVSLGDEEAFARLFERYRNKLFDYIFRHTKSTEISEEIVIDIFMKLWTGRDMASRIQKPAAFFHKVAYHRAIDFLRYASRQERLQKLYADRMEVADEKLPDELMIDEEAKQLLLRAVNDLPPQRQRIYRMSREEGLSHEEIAQTLNLSRSTINNSIISASQSISSYIRRHVREQAALSGVLLYLLLQ